MAVDYTTTTPAIVDLNNYVNQIPKLLGLTKDNKAAMLDVKVIHDLQKGINPVYIKSSNLDIDPELGTGEGSDDKVASQKAVKAYIENNKITGPPGPQGPQGPQGIALNWKGSLAVNPPNPNLNDAYYNTSSKRSYIYSGTSWEILCQDGAHITWNELKSIFEDNGFTFDEGILSVRGPIYSELGFYNGTP